MVYLQGVPVVYLPFSFVPCMQEIFKIMVSIMVLILDGCSSEIGAQV